MKVITVCVRCGVVPTPTEIDGSLKTCVINGSKPTTHMTQRRVFA